MTGPDKAQMHDRISVNNICFPGANFAQLGDHWRELGAGRVSITSSALAGRLADAQAALATGDYRVETMTHVFIRGHLSSDEADWEAPRDRLCQVVQDARTIGAQSIYLLTGGHGTLTWEAAAEAFCAAVSPCAEAAREAGIRLLIENTSPFHADIHIAHSLRDTLALAEIAGLGVCIDLPNCWAEAGLEATIRKAIDRCGVVQVGDYVYGDRQAPCRAVPGDGNIPLRRIVGWLLEAGYAGVFDLELIGPRIDAEGHLPAVRRAAENLGVILTGLGA